MKTLVALFLYHILKKKPSYSTFIDEDTITMGYGKLYEIGDFKYPLPKSIILKSFKHLRWSEYTNQKS